MKTAFALDCQRKDLTGVPKHKPIEIGTTTHGKAIN